MRKKAGWVVIVAAQTLANSILSAILTLMSLSEGWLYALVMWAAVPAIGIATTYLAVRRGLNNYVAWFIPVVSAVSAHWLILGYPPASAGMALLNAGACLVAAAAAQVKNERQLKG